LSRYKACNCIGCGREINLSFKESASLSRGEEVSHYCSCGTDTLIRERDALIAGSPESVKYYIWRNQTFMNLMLWWKKDNLGYESDLTLARIFTEEEIRSKQSQCPEASRNKIAFKCAYIDSLVDESADERSVEVMVIDVSKGIIV